MPFTLSQLRSQDMRDINSFYIQDNIEKLSRANTHVFEGRNTSSENEEDRPAHSNCKKKNNKHEAYQHKNTEDADNLSLDNTIIVNNAKEHGDDLFKTSTQVDAGQNTQNTKQKINKKHKKKRHKEIELENLHKNLFAEKEKNKTKLKTIEDERVFQDSESSCATEGSNKSKRQKFLENNDTLSNYSLENDHGSVSSIDSSSKSVKTKKRRKKGTNTEDIRYDYDDVQALESLNITDIDKPKKKKLSIISAGDQEENNFHSTAVAENTSVLIKDIEKLNNFVMPKKIKLEEDSTFSTDSDLLDSYLYFSYKNKESKKKRKKEKIVSVPMPIIIKTENDLDEVEQSFKNAVDNSLVHSDQSSCSMPKKHKKKHKDHSVEKDKNDSHDETKSVNKKHKKKHTHHVLKDELKSDNHLEDIHSEQIIRSERHENINKVKLQIEGSKEEQHINNIKNSTLMYDTKKKCSPKHQNEDITNLPQKNDESYLRFKNLLLATEVHSRVCDVNEATILKSDKKSKKHKKKKSKDKPEIYIKCSEVTPVSYEKGFDEEQENVKENFNEKIEKLVGKPETSECSKKEFKQKHKESRLPVEDREIHRDTILEPLIDIKMQENSVNSFYIEQEDLTSTCTDRFEIKAIIKKRFDLYEVHENSDVKNDTLNRKACDDVLNSFKKKLSTTLNQCSKQIYSECIGANKIAYRKTKPLENDAPLSLQVYLTFTQTRNDVQDKADCHKKLFECEESKLNHDNGIVLKYKTTAKVQDSVKINSNANKKLFECKESTIVLHSNTLTQDDEQKCTEVNCCKNKGLPEHEESKLISPTNTPTQLDFNIMDDCVNKSAAINLTSETIDCKDNPETILEYHTSNGNSQSLIEDLTMYGNIALDFTSGQQSSPFNKNVKIIQNVSLTKSQILTGASANNNNMEIIALKEMSPPLSFENKSQIENISKDIVLSAEKLSCVDAKNRMQADKSSNVEADEILKSSNIQATNSEQQKDANNQMQAHRNNNVKVDEILKNMSKEDVLATDELICVDASNQMQADKNSNVKVDEILKYSEIQAINSEQEHEILNLEIQAIKSKHHSDTSNASSNESRQILTIFEEETVVFFTNKNKSGTYSENENIDDTFKRTSKENNNQKLESTKTIKKEAGECSSLSFKSFFNNNKAKVNTQKKHAEDVGYQKKLIFNNEAKLRNTKNTTENSSVNNNTPKVSITNKQNENRETQDDLLFTEHLRNRFEDLDSSFSMSDSECESQEKHGDKSSSKLISPNVTDLYNQLMCGTSVDGDETAVDEIINEALENAVETSINLIEENQFLRDLAICIPWEIPPAHTIETRMSSHPTPAQRNKFKELSIPLKSGPYTKKEDKIILNNFEDFCKVHDISHDPKPFLNFKYARKTLLNQKQRIQFVQYLGKGLECRMLYSIYRRFVCLRTEKKKGRFTREENAIIEKYINNKQGKHDNKKFATLSKILNRDRLAVEKRYKYLLSKQKLKKDKYKIKDHISEYIKHLMEILEVKEVNQLKDMKITRNVWLKLANKIGQTEFKVKHIWETIIYTRLFAKNPIDVDKIMKQLISKLIELKKTDYRDVNWCEIAKEFENVTPAYLYQMFRRLVGTYVPERKRNDLSGTLKHLARAYQECDSILTMQSKMEFQNGKVSFITDSS